jgi:hypothetical protein
MARVANWNVDNANEKMIHITMDRLEAAAKVVEHKAKSNLHSYIGKGKTTGISRPVYQSGKHKGKPWTARDFGALLSTIRTVRLYGDPNQNIWVMAGNKKVYYAQIVEFYCSYLRKALHGSKSTIRTIIRNGNTAKGGTF